MTSYKQRIEEILHNYRQDTILIDNNNLLLSGESGRLAFEKSIAEATIQLLALMDEFGDEVIGQDTPRKVEYFDKVEQQNVYSNESDLTRRTENELRAVARNRKKGLLL